MEYSPERKAAAFICEADLGAPRSESPLSAQTDGPATVASGP